MTTFRTSPAFALDIYWSQLLNYLPEAHYLYLCAACFLAVLALYLLVTPSQRNVLEELVQQLNPDDSDEDENDSQPKKTRKTRRGFFSCCRKSSRKSKTN